MKRFIFGVALAGIFALNVTSAFANPEAEAEAKTKEPAVSKMSKDDLIKTARSAAPDFISKNASIMLPGPDGKLTEVQKGTNGFTCIPDIDGQEKADPICADEAAMQWVNDLMAKKDKPSNTEPGIAYMMEGGWHWEKDGKVVMDPATPGAKRTKEPPHWMIFWPFESAKTGLPANPGDFKTYVMFDGTPYSHLMIYQNPKDIKHPKKQ